MQDFEKLGLFYLGAEYDLAGGRRTATPLLYESRDLVTHAVCVGMTGSGKTGLCLGLIEEAAIDGIPVLAIDPKGDLGNLLLTFPGLAPADFRPWVDEDEARRAGLSADAFAEMEANRWRDGLAEWGQDAERIERLRQSAHFTIFTPGSNAGRPLSILGSFAVPPAAVVEDAEALAERAGGTATSLLALAGAESAPRTREHTLVSTLLGTAWREGRDLDLASLITGLQTPPFQRVGVVDVDSFFPAKDRFDLAMRINALLAAPGFEPWLDGDSLDPSQLLYGPDGRPRVAICSIAHLPDSERMFFVSLLLNQVLSWSRGLTGTSSLRAILYMDEIQGYFPPVANPPSKAPLLTLLKQARAFGVGVVLATQNPVDLDYKGLGNTGTWFLGRLQAERDKARVLDGLEGAAAGSLDRTQADRMLSSLAKRTFLLHNVHAAAPIVFQTRWTMSYLRGPMSREQIRAVMGGRPAEAAGEPPGHPATVSQAGPASAITAGPATPPVLPPGVLQYFVPAPAGTPGIRYVPVVLGAARVTVADRRLDVEESRDVLYAAPLTEGPVPLDWTSAQGIDVPLASLRREPQAGASYAELPSAASQPKSYQSWEKSFLAWIAGAERVEMWRHAGSKLTSRSGESERDFRIRVREARHAARDAAIDAMRRKYASKENAVAERIRRAQAAVAREQAQASQQKLQASLSVGATILGALFGRRAASVGTVGRATTAARGIGRSMKEAADIKRAEENVDALRRQEQALTEEIAAETEAIATRYEGEPELERVTLTPKRGQITVHFVALGWLPR